MNQCRFSEDDEESKLLSCMYTTAVKGSSLVGMHATLAVTFVIKLAATINVHRTDLVHCVALFSNGEVILSAHTLPVRLGAARPDRSAAYILPHMRQKLTTQESRVTVQLLYIVYRYKVWRDRIEGHRSARLLGW